MSDADTFPNDPALDVLKGFGSRAASVGRAFGFLILWLLFLMVFSSFCALALGLKAQTLPDGRQVIPGMGSDPTVSAVFEAASFLGALLATAIICTRGGLSARDVGFRLDGVGRSLAIGAGLGLSLLTTVVLVTIGLGGIRLAPFDLHGFEAPLWFVGFAVLFGLVALTEELTIRGPLLTLFGRAFGFWPAATISSLIFMVLHMANPGETPIGLANVFLVGLALAWTRRRTGSLWLAIGFHAAWDFAQSYLFGVRDSGATLNGAITSAAISGPDWLSGGATGPEGGVICTASLLWLIYAVNALWPKPKAPSAA